MKMAPGVFWGIILIIVGFIVIIKVVFNINIPLMRVVFASILILIGIRILFGGGNNNHSEHRFYSSDENTEDIIFGEQEHNNIYELKKEYNVVFGKGYYDFSNFDTIDTQKRTAFNIVFGSAVLKIHPDLPLIIKSDAVFSGLKFPNGNTAVFGTNYYRSPSYDENKPHLYIKTDAVFSGLEIIY